MPRAGRTPSKSVTAQSIMGKHAARGRARARHEPRVRRQGEA